MVDTASIRDVIVVVPGIMGSELVDANGKTLWSVSPGSLIGSIRALASAKLTLPADIGDDPAPDGVRARRATVRYRRMREVGRASGRGRR